MAELSKEKRKALEERVAKSQPGLKDSDLKPGPIFQTTVPKPLPEAGSSPVMVPSREPGALKKPLLGGWTPETSDPTRGLTGITDPIGAAISGVMAPGITAVNQIVDPFGSIPKVQGPQQPEPGVGATGDLITDAGNLILGDPNPTYPAGEVVPIPKTQAELAAAATGMSPTQGQSQPAGSLSRVDLGMGALDASDKRLADYNAQTMSAITEKAGQEEINAGLQAAAQAEYTQRLKDGLAEIGNKQKELEAMEPKDFWADKSTGQKVGIALAVLLGGIGQGLSGAKENAALNALNKAMDDDRAAFESKYKRKSAAIAARKDQLGVDKTLHDSRMTELAARDNAALAHVNGIIDRAAAGAKSEEARQKTLELKTNLSIKQEELNLKQQEILAKSLPVNPQGRLDTPAGKTDAGGTQTEGQLKVEGFLERIDESEKDIYAVPPNVLLGRGKDPSKASPMDRLYQQSVNAETPFGLGKGLEWVKGMREGDILSNATPEQRRYLIGAQIWIASVLRPETGAAIGSAEFAELYARHFPMPSDTPESIEQKRRSREAVRNGLITQTGRNLGRRRPIQ